jgi:pimeloyl-ACP methyl ester carboxylesterase
MEGTSMPMNELADLVNGDAALVRRGRFLSTSFLVEVGETPWLVTVEGGRIARVERGPFLLRSWTFALRAPADAWERFWQPLPPPGYHDVLAMARFGVARIEGDLQPLMANLEYVKQVLAAPRRPPVARAGGVSREDQRAALRPSDVSAQRDVIGSDESAPAARPRDPGADRVPAIEPIVGRYLHLDLEGRPHRVYFEEAGQGIPLLCLHTAGSDTRQFRHLMTDEEITRAFRVIAFDMPWHGKSTPPAGWEHEEYRLTSRRYVDTICAFAEALGLERPVALGCSIGGRIVLHLALERADRFRALIGLESADWQQPWYDTAWLHRPDVHGGEVSAAMVSGLVGPESPAESRWETLWAYLISGPGVFKGDLHFYRVDSDLRGRVGAIDTRRCPLYLLTGEYDFSCTPEDTERTAKAIPGARYRMMRGLGHFPMSEDPARFREYILPVLDEIRRRG